MNQTVPFRSLYSNDTTNLENCTSAYHAKGENFTPEHLRESVREVEGLADVHLIQLAHGQVPWYQSRVYPFREHLKWWSDYFGVPMETLEALRGCNGYVRDGGDILADFIDACRAYGQAAFVSVRLNDEHHVEWIDKKGHTNGIHSISRFLAEHRDLMFGGDLQVWANRALNWIHPEVPAHMLELITEQCENYDIDGLELDFMRYPHLFDLSQTTFAERAAVTERFLAAVRAVLDRTARNSRHRYLCVRVPSDIGMWDAIGLLPERLESLGVEMVNVSSSYFTDQWVDFGAFPSRMPNLAVYFEICHCTTTGTALNANGYDNFLYRRTTENEIYTTAHMAYRHGAQGLSYFNFAYYREHGSAGRGPFNEPPFDAIGLAKNREFVAHAPQHFFLAKGWSDKTQLRDPLAGDTVYAFRMYAEPPADGWKTGFRFRLLTRTPIGTRRFRVTFNGHEPEETDCVKEPYPEDARYRPMHGDAGTLRAWTVARDAVCPGENRITVEWTSPDIKEPIRVDYMDLFPDEEGKE